MTTFGLRREWITQPNIRTELDATFADLIIEVGGVNITKFSGDYDAPSESIALPVYGIAEWLAENWWSLLWEPKKNEDRGDSRQFKYRHSLLAAQQGFALPDLTIIPNGDNIILKARSAYNSFAEVKFSQAATCLAPRADIERVLRAFVADTVDRLNSLNIKETDLHELWSNIVETSDEEHLFCKLTGALGLSPYSASDKFAEKLEKMLEQLGESLLFDLCLASTYEEFDGAAEQAVAAKLNNYSSLADLASLSAIEPPAEDLSLPAWQIGVNAAKRVRDRLNISDTDPLGGRKFLDLLRVDVHSPIAAAPIDTDDAPVLGVVLKDGNDARIGLLQPHERQRRFSATRGTYLAWTGRRMHDARLMTWAVTRDQQASRAFAAEMTAPRAYLRNVLRNRSKNREEIISETAATLGVSEGVIVKQAENNGII
ncbi:hypothetical protein DFO45_2312 [Azorhizobium sp. AG788]|uniref:hypothetical protein n=1 Tax=Azorhizobium sp. AG788 TaxID=2183897 RepID=UPI00105D8499|nr:hypothetical protein [Azorhizobium sp. AG788]TDT94562.1 hypothetical protein DFO45_2312 [Azorhizobium sp. AG788]